MPLQTEHGLLPYCMNSKKFEYQDFTDPATVMGDPQKEQGASLFRILITLRYFCWLSSLKRLEVSSV